jgi:hypothetical protein
MTSKSSTSLYDQVVRVTNVYLGPAAERFIARQVENHLHKSPEDLSPKDLLSLIDWIRVVVSLLTEDSEIIEEYAAELQKLADKGHGRSSKTAPHHS